MANTTNLMLPFLEAAQAQKHVTVNEALLALDSLVQPNILDRDLTIPPGSPLDGDRYIVASGATGAWAGKDFNITVWQDGLWKFYDPREGWLAWVRDESLFLVYRNATWDAYAAPNVSGGNLLLNGAFNLDQRAASPYSTGYTMDRWELVPSGAMAAVTQGAFTAGQTDVPGEPEFYLKMDVTAGNADVAMQQKIEGVRTLAGDTITASIWIWCDKAISFDIGFHQEFGSGGSADVSAGTTTVTTVANTWTKFTVTKTLPLISGKTIGAGNALRFQLSDPGVNVAEFRFANAKVEMGGVATKFEKRMPADEISLAQRFYQKIQMGPIGFVQNASTIQMAGVLNAPMRDIPTVVLMDSSPRIRVQSNTFITGSGSAITSSTLFDHGYRLQINGFSGLTAQDYFLLDNNVDVLEFDAEL